MNYLIGDIGNTNIKICKLNKNFKIINTYLFQTKNSNLENNLKKKLNQLLNKDTNKKVLFSSVVPKIFKKVIKIFKGKSLKVFEIKEFNLKKIIKFKVKKYSQLGSDRIANTIGAYYKFKKNCIVIDFGTATTFDVIKKKCIYDGGVIAPGIKLSIENLFSSTALLPMFKLSKYPINYGKNTKEALSSGFFWGYEGLINNIIKKIIKKNGINFIIVLTGGYSYLFKNRLIKKAKIENDITMQGIIKIYKDFLYE
tara:strand:+ start:1012 stop:1773 length:762 start_codon:yes stop_codon:yes gene_type:complete